MDELYPYQQHGAKWLAGRKAALLADDMGLGKTAQAITACDIVGAKSILVVCPAIARENWRREFQRFSSLRRSFFVGTDGGTDPPSDSSVITSFDLALRYYRTGVLSRRRFDVLIVDEAHFLKEPSAQRTQAILGAKGFAHQSERVWFLTGTPMPSHPGELWPMLFTFGATKLSYQKFLERYCLLGPGHSRYAEPRVVGAKRLALPELTEILFSVMLRRKKETVLPELPPLSITEVLIKPTPFDLRLSTFGEYTYNIPGMTLEDLNRKISVEESTLRNALMVANSDLQDYEKGTGTRATMDVLAALSTSMPTLRRYLGMQKAVTAADMVSDELFYGHYEKIVIFAVHRDVVHYLKARLRLWKPVYVNGGLEPDTQQKMMDKFLNNTNCRVFIGNIRACGTAITLTTANEVLFVEQEWVPAHNTQAMMRVHRIGQKKPVRARFMAIEGSIDEYVSRVLRRKSYDIASLLRESN